MLYVLFIGLLVGIVAKLFMPGKAPGGIIMTIVLGIGGAIVANWIGEAFGLYANGEPVGFFAAVLGAMVIIGIYQMFLGKKA